MRKVLSLALAVMILLSTVITSVIVLANNTGDVTNYDVVKTESASPDNLFGASSNVSISMSGSKISTGSYNGYKLNANGWKMWRPTFLFLTESGGVKSKFITKQNARYIVEMEYVVTSNRTDNHSLQVGLFGNIGANGQTENAIWLDTDSVGNKLYKTHPAADNGKTVRYTVAFTATSAHNVGLIFYGQGSITLNTLKIAELPSEHAGNYAAVKYVDGDDVTGEFVKKNSPLKTPVKDGNTFGGWYTNSGFTGTAVTTVSADTTLYAKWLNSSDSVDTNIKTTVIDLTQNTANVFVTTGSTTATTATVEGGKLNVNVSAYERQLSNITSYSTLTWFPNYLLAANGANLYLTTGSRAIVEVKYKVVGTPNPTHGTQIGIGNFNGGKGSNIYVRTSRKHVAGDEGKEFVLTTNYTVDNKPAIKIAVSGGGKIEISSIIVHELPAQYINDYAVVKFVDGNNETTEFVKKNKPIKIPEKDGYTFGGWYTNKAFSGEAVTTVNADTTLYSKWDTPEGFVAVNFHDGSSTETKKYAVGDAIDKTPSKQGFNFLGWYKYENYVGRPVTTATEGLTDLYAKWEEKNPDTEIIVDLTKNETMVTTGKTADSKVTLDNKKLIFDIYNYERQLNSTDTSNADSWFPAYYFYDSSSNRIALDIGATYELEVTYKVIDVKAGNNIGLQIGFGADGQVGSRTRIKGYRAHIAEDKGKEFTLSTSYTAEKFNFGKEHLPKLLFSGQGVLEVKSIKIKKILPIIKDTVIGTQTYEDYAVGTETGVLGNKKGTEVSNQANYTSGLLKKKSLKLTLNTNYLRMTGNTVISLLNDGELKPYAAEKGAAYRITFYMYANQNMNDLTWSVNSVDSTLQGDYLKYFHMETQDKVSLKKGEWKKVTAYIPVLKGCTSSRNLIAIAVASNGYDGKAVYIDDVKVEQLVDSDVLLYDTMGGEELEPQRAFAGQRFVTFKEPTKQGYLFDGWYYDKEYKNEAKVSDKFPEGKTEITLYAKWIASPTTAKDFTAGSFDGEIYNDSIEPYENAVADMDSPIDFANGKGMTSKVAWVKDAGIYGNGKADTDGALAFSNDFYSSYNDAYGYNVVRLTNEDGTPFTVVKGQRYTIEFDYIFASHKGLSYIIPVISEHSAYADIGHSSYQTLGKVSVMETDTDYLSYKQSFVAERTGYVYLTLTGRDDNARVDVHCYEKVYVDNVKIECDSNVTKVLVKNGNTTWYTLYGIKGEKLILPNAVKDGADTFDGFYLDADFKHKFDGYFPENDTTIYVKLKKDKYDTPSDFSKPIVLDFEETELLEDFYRQQKYMTSWAREVENEWIFITDDEANALSGKNYIKLNGFSHYWNQAKFALYDPNHPENVMLLDKGGKYRVTVMVRCADIYESPVNMTICLENPSQKHLLAENGNVKLEYVPEGDRNGYFMFVGDIEVSENMAYYPTLAIRRNANDLQTIYIDTVSVEKLRDCTVKFEENGGTAVEDSTLQIHDLLFDPGVPYKEGFVFDGWFTDSSFVKKWDFDKDTVEDDMTLYAKWSVEIVSEDENDEPDIEETVTDTDIEETVDNGKAPNLLDADKVVIEKEADDVSENTDDGMQLWMIILICAGAFVILAAAVFVIIILIHKRKKKQSLKGGKI